MEYAVFAVIYISPSYGPAAVAVSASDERAAIKRLKGHRPARVLTAFKIEGRSPEYAQDRIEGTVNLNEPLMPPPPAGSPRAEVIRDLNAAIIGKKYANAS